MRFSSPALGSVALAASLLCLPAAAHADSYTTFDFSGVSYYSQYSQSPTDTPMTGTITFDNTTQSISGVSGFSFSYPDGTSFGPLVSWQSGTYLDITHLTGSYSTQVASYPFLQWWMPTSELSSGLGGPVCGYQVSHCTDDSGRSVPASNILVGAGEFYWVNGTLTPETASNVAPTPEPASLALLLTGLGGVATQLRRRRK